MAPVIYCVRHAQGLHNIAPEFVTLADPELSALGKEQCATLRKTLFPNQSQLSLIAASPLTRTLQTAYETFEPALKNGGKCNPVMLAIPDAQESSDLPCDTGSNLNTLQMKIAQKGWPVNLDLVRSGWNDKSVTSRYSPLPPAIKRRAHDARLLIRQKARELVAAGDVDAQIVLVCHGNLLHYFTDDWEGGAKFTATGWTNTETRTYTFEHGVESEDAEARLIELEESRARRGLPGSTKGPEEQAKLYEIVLQVWKDQCGYGEPTIAPVLDDEQDSGVGTADGETEVLAKVVSREVEVRS